MSNYPQRCAHLIQVIKPIYITIFIVFLLSGCTLKKPYVGLEVNTNNWPQYRSGQHITFRSDAAKFEITVTDSQEEGEYNLEGIMDGSEGVLKSISHLVIRDCRFSILLAKNGVVVDNISFFPRGKDHRHKLPFKKKFKTVPFDSISISYQMSVAG